MSDTQQAQREGWIEKKVQRVMRNYDLKDRQTLYDLTDVLRDAMAFADAHPAVASMPKLTPATVEDERIEKLSRGKNDETKMA